MENGLLVKKTDARRDPAPCRRTKPKNFPAFYRRQTTGESSILSIRSPRREIGRNLYMRSSIARQLLCVKTCIYGVHERDRELCLILFWVLARNIVLSLCSDILNFLLIRIKRLKIILIATSFINNCKIYFSYRTQLVLR